MARFGRTVGAIVVVLLLLATPAGAHGNHLGGILAAYWAEIFRLRAGDNPYAGGDPCVPFTAGGHPYLIAVLPAGSPSPAELSCPVPAGASIFVTAWTTECSTVELPPFYGRDEKKLRKCAERDDKHVHITSVTLDGKPLPVAEVETPLVTVTLGADNVFGKDPGTTAQFVAHGWVAVLDRLARGAHTVVIEVRGKYPAGGLPVTSINHFTVS